MVAERLGETMVIDVLRDSELFAGLDQARFARLAMLCRSVSFRRDDIVFRQGEEAGEVFIVQSGMVVLELPMPSSDEAPSQLLPIETVIHGNCFGWSAVVEPYTYTLTARCQEATTALALKGTRLRDLMAEDPALGCEVTTSLARLVARRLTETRIRLTSGLGVVLYPSETEAAG
jgi:CRP-like cAMP-binding protein